MDVFHDLLAAFDITPEEAERLDSPLGDYRPQGTTIPPEEVYVELSANGLSVEIPNAEFCERLHRVLREKYGFSEEQLTWFTMLPRSRRRRHAKGSQRPPQQTMAAAVLWRR
jgi:hypothetical protein